LIADGDRSLAESLSRGLEQQGYYVLIAKTGEDAAQLARLNRAQLIVAEHRLPDMDGTTLLEQLASDVQTCHIPAIILSNMERPDIIRRSRVGGCQYFVRKPFDLKALFFLIQHALEETAQLAAGNAV
jgi:CheY-like chemotaxis protein